MPDQNQQPSEYELLMQRLKEKTQQAGQAARQAWGGKSIEQQQQDNQEGKQPVYMQAGSQPHYQGDADTVMKTGGFAHGSNEMPPPPPPEPTPAIQNAPPPYMAPPPPARDSRYA